LHPGEDGRCRECGAEAAAAVTTAAEIDFLAIPEMRYQNAYVWLVLVSALDVILTLLAVYVWEGREINPIAAAVIEAMGFAWGIVLKFASILLVIIICEVVGRHDDRKGQALAILAILLNVAAAMYTCALLIWAGPVVRG
jgi:hypothetical protein